MENKTDADTDVQNQLRRQFAAEKNIIVTGVTDEKTIYSTPSSLMRPTITADGDMFCALTGPDLQIGVCGFGKTPALALADYDRNFVHQAAPRPAKKKPA
jgi:hypothetical protein